MASTRTCGEAHRGGMNRPTYRASVAAGFSFQPRTGAPRGTPPNPSSHWQPACAANANSSTPSAATAPACSDAQASSFTAANQSCTSAWSRNWKESSAAASRRAQMVASFSAAAFWSIVP